MACSALNAALLARFFTQSFSLAQAGYSEFGWKYCRTLDVVGRLWLWHGSLGGANHSGRPARSLYFVFSQRLYLHERHASRFL